MIRAMAASGAYARARIRTRAAICGFVAVCLYMAVLIGGLTFAPDASERAWADDAAAQVEQAASLDAQGLLSAVQRETGASQSDSYSASLLNPDDGTSAWIAFDFARAGLLKDASGTLDVVRSYVTESYASSYHGLDDLRPTTWSRAITLIATLGGDPTSFGSRSDGSKADLVSDGLENWSYTANYGEQGSNAWIWGLVALTASDAKLSDDARYTPRIMVDELLACQAEDGSFSLNEKEGSGSVDVTGMALAALAPYRDREDVSQAIQKAVEYLSNVQQEDGSFSDDMAGSDPTCESTAMAIIGLSAVGVDADTDERFIKGGTSALAALLSFQKGDGTFAHTASDLGDADVDTLPSEQALRALLSYLDLANGGDGNVYTADVKIALSLSGGGSSDGSGSASQTDASLLVRVLASLAVGIVLGLIVVGILWLISRLRKRKRARVASRGKRDGSSSKGNRFSSITKNIKGNIRDLRK